MSNKPKIPDKKSFLLYCDQSELIQKLSDEQAGCLIKQIYLYCCNGRKVPTIPDALTDIVFTALKTSLDRDYEKYTKIVERNRNNGQLGGRPKNNPLGSLGTQKTQANPKNPSEPDSDSDSDSDSGKDSDKRKQPLPPKPKKKKKVFIPPTKEEVINFFIENEYDGNKGANAFDFYAEADWFDSRGNKVKNWKQKMRGVWFKEDNKVVQNKFNGSGQTMTNAERWVQNRRARENGTK